MALRAVKAGHSAERNVGGKRFLVNALRRTGSAAPGRGAQGCGSASTEAVSMPPSPAGASLRGRRADPEREGRRCARPHGSAKGPLRPALLALLAAGAAAERRQRTGRDQADGRLGGAHLRRRHRRDVRHRHLLRRDDGRRPARRPPRRVRGARSGRFATAGGSEWNGACANGAAPRGSGAAWCPARTPAAPTGPGRARSRGTGPRATCCVVPTPGREPSSGRTRTG
jgi:hypothetical protein